MKSSSDWKYCCLNHGDLLPNKDLGSIDYRRIGDRKDISRIKESTKFANIYVHIIFLNKMKWKTHWGNLNENF